MQQRATNKRRECNGHKATLGLSLQFSPGKCSQSQGWGAPGEGSLEGNKLWEGSGQRRPGGEKRQRLEDALSSRDPS